MWDEEKAPRSGSESRGGGSDVAGAEHRPSGRCGGPATSAAGVVGGGGEAAGAPPAARGDVGPGSGGGAGLVAPGVGEGSIPPEAIPDRSSGAGGAADDDVPLRVPRLSAGPPKGRRLVKAEESRRPPVAVTPEQRLLVLDTWRRSGLPATAFAELVGVSKHTLYAWKKRFEEEGPAGLLDRPRPKQGSRLPDLARRTVLMLKQDHPDWGCQRISDTLLRGPGLAASASAVATVLHEAGYVLEEAPTAPHPPRVQRFERAKPNQLWQSDLFTFLLKRQNQRVFLVAFMDDHSRFVVGYGLHASASGALVLEVFRSALATYGTPEEVLTDNGPQYITWRGTSLFAKELQRRGIRHVVASPRHPQTLGKTERFWGTLWRECLEAAVFLDLADARKRVGHFIDYYNFHRPHQGIESAVPADRFFELAPQVRRTLEARVAANPLDLARHGVPKAPFYVTGQAGGKTFSLHAQGERVILSREGEEPQEVDLVAPQGPPAPMPEPACPQGVVGGEEPAAEELPPGVFPLDEGLKRLGESTEQEEGDVS